MAVNPIKDKWAGLSRTAQRVKNNLGTIFGANVSKVKKFRTDILDTYDQYYDGKQYDSLMKWDEAMKCTGDDYVPVRNRKPRVQYAYAKVLTSRVAAKLVGKKAFPELIIEEDPDAQQFIKSVVQMAKLQARLIEPMRRCLNSGSVFVRFSFVGGALKMEHFNSKYCYPTFQDNGELEQMRIRYVYTDTADIDEQGKPREKWYQLDLGMFVDTLYDNPLYNPQAEPQFTEVNSVQHDLGYVQGEWFRTLEDKHTPDGYSLIGDILGFIDDINYSLSQSSQAISYNQEPQLAINGMDSEELDMLIKSSAKAWNLGRDGEGKFIESSLEGVQTADTIRDKMKLGISDITRVIMLDPEKFTAQAESGKAMEMLLGPLVELIEELRTILEPSIINLILKIAVTTLRMAEMGLDVGIELPPGWKPQSLNLTLHWPQVIPMTTKDLQAKVQVVVSATAGNILSRETGTRYIAGDFGVVDVESEIAKIAAQPILNPFGAF